MPVFLKLNSLKMKNRLLHHFLYNCLGCNYSVLLPFCCVLTESHVSFSDSFGLDLLACFMAQNTLFPFIKTLACCQYSYNLLGTSPDIVTPHLVPAYISA